MEIPIDPKQIVFFKRTPHVPVNLTKSLNKGP